jgi:hypothetical protein
MQLVHAGTASSHLSYNGQWRLEEISRSSPPLTLLTLHWRHDVFDLLVTPEAFVVMERVTTLHDVDLLGGEGSQRRGSSKMHCSLSAVSERP